MTTEFKVGDRIKFFDCTSLNGFRIGQTAMILEFYPKSKNCTVDSWTVRFDSPKFNQVKKERLYILLEKYAKVLPKEWQEPIKISFSDYCYSEEVVRNRLLSLLERQENFIERLKSLSKGTIGQEILECEFSRFDDGTLRYHEMASRVLEDSLVDFLHFSQAGVITVTPSNYKNLKTGTVSKGGIFGLGAKKVLQVSEIDLLLDIDCLYTGLRQTSYGGTEYDKYVVSYTIRRIQIPATEFEGNTRQYINQLYS